MPFALSLSKGERHVVAVDVVRLFAACKEVMLKPCLDWHSGMDSAIRPRRRLWGATIFIQWDMEMHHMTDIVPNADIEHQ